MKSVSQRTALLGLVITLVAAGTAGYRMLRVHETAIEHLEQELATANEQLQRLAKLVDAMTETLVTEDPTPVDKNLPRTRLEESNPGQTSEQHNLEASVAELQRQWDEVLPKMEKVFQAVQAYEEAQAGLSIDRNTKPTAEELRRFQEAMFAESLTIERKLQMFQQLRHYEAVTDEAARHMVDQYYAADDVKKTNILGLMNGIVTPELRTALLHAAENEESQSVRRAAAGTMQYFLPDSEVQEWLEHLASNDPSWRVRLRATESLNVYLDEVAGQESQ